MINQIPIKDESKSEIRQSKDIEEGKAIVCHEATGSIRIAKARYK